VEDIRCVSAMASGLFSGPTIFRCSMTERSREFLQQDSYSKIQRMMLLRLGIWRRCWFQAYVGAVISKACPDFQCFPEADYKVGNNN
jgi:hypothetical protein